MKQWLLYFALVGVLAIPVTNAPVEPAVALYDHCDFDELIEVFSSDVENFKEYPGLNNEVSFIEVIPGYRVTLFEFTFYNGNSETFEPGAYCLEGTVIGRNAASSLKVERIEPPSEPPSFEIYLLCFTATDNGTTPQSTTRCTYIIVTNENVTAGHYRAFPEP